MAYIADDGEVLCDFYMSGLWEYQKMHQKLNNLKQDGHEITFPIPFQEVQIRPLDIVRWVKDPTWVGIVTEGNNNSFSVNWFSNSRAQSLSPHNAWHNLQEGKIEKIANLPDVLASAMAHPFGGGAHKPYDLI